MPSEFAVVWVAAFVLQQIQVESPAEEEALESECLQGAEWPQAAQAPPPPLAAAEAVNPREQLRAVEKPQPPPNESLKLHRLPSRNTIAAVAGRSVVWAFRFVLVILPYQNHCCPGTALRDSLLISKEIL